MQSSSAVAVDVRKSISKYQELHEKLWARSRDAVLKRNRIDAAEGRLVDAASNEEERQYHRRLYELRVRALDFSIKELAIEISHVSDVLESLRNAQVAQDTGTGNIEESKVASLAFERYEEWAGSSHELYAMRSQALEVATEIMRVRAQPPKSQESDRDEENDLYLSLALGHVRSHAQSFSGAAIDEPDGPAALLQSIPRASSASEWWQRLLSTSTQRTPQQTYMRALFNTSGHVHTFEARKILEYVEECEKFASTAMRRRPTVSYSDAATSPRRTPADATDASPPCGIEPKRFHEFMAVMSCYVVEQQRELHNEEWDDEEVQLILEEHVMSSVRSLAKTFTERPAEDLKFREKCDRLASATQEQLGVPREYASSELVPYCEAIALLRSMFFALTPSKKLFCVASAANTIFEQLRTAGVAVNRIGADVFMDIWVYVIVKANVSDLISSMSFMAEYAVRSLSTGQAGYFLASLQVAISAIVRLDLAAVLKPDDSVGAIVVCQREKYWKLAGQPVSHFQIVNPCLTLVGYKLCAVREWLLNSARFFSVILRHTPDDANAVVSVAVIKFNLGTVTPPQMEFLKKVFLPSDQPGLYVRDTPLGQAVCVRDEMPALSILELDCHDYTEVEQSLLDGLAMERLGISFDDEAQDRETLPGSPAAASGPFEHFSQSRVSELEVRFREEYSVSKTLCLHDAISTVVQVAQTICQHLEHLSSLTPVDGVYNDLLFAAVKVFKNAHKQANVDNAKCAAWTDDGVLTPQVFAAMKASLNSYMADLAHLGFLLPYGVSSCDPGERARAQVRQLISSCQRGWHLPVHIHGSLGKKTKEEIRRRMAMLNNLRPVGRVRK